MYSFPLPFLTAGYLDAGNARAVYVPAGNIPEKYDTSQPAVRRWVASALRACEQPDACPVLVHC